jgi:hypothetical protein
MADLIAELEGVVRACDDAQGHAPLSDTELCLRHFIRTHHAEIAAAVRDAARYRWLRSMDGSCSARAHVSFNIGFDWDEAHGDRLDAAIDTAMRAGEGEG